MLIKKNTVAESNSTVTKEKKKIDFKALIKNRVFLAGSAIFLSAMLVFGGNLFMDKMLNNTVYVIKAKTEILKGKPITQDMLVAMEAGKLGLASDAIYDMSNAVGKFAKVDIFSGDLITEAKVSVIEPFEFPYLHNLHPNELAISVSLSSSAAGLSSKVRAGDIVSIFGTPLEDKSGGENLNAMAPAELKYVKVLAVSDEGGIDIVSSNQYADGKMLTPSSVTLLVNSAQATLLAGLEQKSRIHLALVTRDQDIGSELLKEQEAYFTHIPVVLPPMPQQEEQENG